MKDELSAANQKVSLQVALIQNSASTAQEKATLYDELQKRYNDTVAAHNSAATECATLQVRAQKAADERGMYHWSNVPFAH